MCLPCVLLCCFYCIDKMNSWCVLYMCTLVNKLSYVLCLMSYVRSRCSHEHLRSVLDRRLIIARNCRYLNCRTITPNYYRAIKKTFLRSYEHSYDARAITLRSPCDFNRGQVAGACTIGCKRLLTPSISPCCVYHHVIFKRN